MQQRKNQAAFECGQLAERMVAGYFAHAAAIGIAADTRAMALVPAIQPGFSVPIGSVYHKDGTPFDFCYEHYLDLARTDPAIASELKRVWLAGALLTVGDAADVHRYFDKAPELELLRHLRNGVAHGNRFNIKSVQRPAHNKLAWARSVSKSEFEITPALHGQSVLFDFMGPADVVELLMSIGIYLIRTGNGDPLR
jgi:hypothetical protein